MDSPGIGESQIMDDMVKEYLPEAFAFIYVINIANAGGIQSDRVCNIYMTKKRPDLNFSPDQENHFPTLL